MGIKHNPHIPTEKSRAEVQALASFGVNRDEISGYLGIDRKTLSKHYKPELETSALKVHAHVASFLANAATGAALKQGTGATFRDCLTAAMFYGKTRMGLRETNNMDVTSNGETLKPTQIILTSPADEQSED